MINFTISAFNWGHAFIKFPWWAEAHLTGYQKWAAKMHHAELCWIDFGQTALTVLIIPIAS